MAKKFLVFQHTPWEGPGQLLLDGAKRHRVALEVVRVWAEAIPPLQGYDGLIVLGGSPNIDQEQQFPFLVAEKRAIRQSLAADRPYLGFCLGHQLLADAMGAKVGENFCTSIGFVAGHLTQTGREHPVFQASPPKFPLFKWHAQTVLEPVPRQLEILMTSAECQVEAIAVAGRPHLLGMQSYNQAALPNEVENLLHLDRKWLSSIADRTVYPSQVLADARIYAAAIAKDFQQFWNRYLKLVA